MQQHLVNKSIVLEFYRRAIGQGDLDFANQVIADEYIQHSPMVKAGKAGILEALQYLKHMPKPTHAPKPFMKLVAEGDYVATYLRVNLAGQEKLVADLFRLREGKVVEHWDAVQNQSESALNNIIASENSSMMVDPALTKESKKIAVEFYQQVFMGQQSESVGDFVQPNILQHSPGIGQGAEGLCQYLRSQAGKFSVSKLHRIISEGDMVVFQSEGLLDHHPHVFYDLFRVSNGQIAEHWGVNQPIPASMPHANGMV